MKKQSKAHGGQAVLSKKAQLTFFVIIGILAIVAVSATLMIFSYSANPKNPANTNQASVQNTQLTLKQCSAQQFEKSIRLAALQGGYITLPSDIVSGNAYFTPYPNTKFALWQKAGVSFIPTIDDIQAQVQADLKQRIIDNCLSAIPSATGANPDVTVTLGTGRNTADINFHTTITEPGSSTQITTLEVDNTLPFVDTYNTANNAIAKMSQEKVLTTLNYNLLSLDAEIPKTGVEISCNRQTWKVPDLKDSYFQFVQQMMPDVSFDGTTTVNANSQEQQLAQKQLTFDIISNNNYQLYASYHYQQFGGTFDVPTSVGGIITSNVIRSPGSNYCESHYNFFYDMNYPVFFQLRNTEGQDPFIMRFALPVSVDRNTLTPSTTNPVAGSSDAGGAGTGSTTSPSGTQSSYCKDTTIPKATLDIVDESGTPITGGLQASVSCGQYTCYLNTDSSGKIVSYFPRRCLTGTITVTKEGYGVGTLTYNSYDFNSLSSTPIKLQKMQKLTLQCTSKGQPAECDFTSYAYMITNGNGDYQVFSQGNAPIYVAAGSNPEFSILQKQSDGSYTNPYDTGSNDNAIDAGRLPITAGGQNQEITISVKNDELSGSNNKISNVATYT